MSTCTPSLSVRYMKVEAVRHIRPIWQRLALPFTIANLPKEVKVWTWGLRVTTTKICHQGAFITIFTIITIFTLAVGANQILGSHSLASLTLRSSGTGLGMGYPNTHSSGPIEPLPSCLPACLRCKGIYVWPIGEFVMDRSRSLRRKSGQFNNVSPCASPSLFSHVYSLCPAWHTRARS